MKRRKIFLLTALMAVLTGCAVKTDIYKSDIPAITETAEPRQGKLKVGSITEPPQETKPAANPNPATASPIPSEGSAGIPSYNGKPYTEINKNIPMFDEGDRKRTDAFETYSELDRLGRCGTAYANICRELMPEGDREEISHVKPSGWNNKPYRFVDGGYIYNRCHLIGFQLAGENANEKNLITGTRYMNVEGMLPFENRIADYVYNTNNHVLYRVTPVYNGENLVASGVQMEAYSVEDSGKGIQFNIYCHNVQPGCVIDYKTGDNREEADYNTEKDAGESMEITTDDVKYILNTNSKKFHSAGCSATDDISENNRQEYSGSRNALIQDGYSPCGLCKP